MAPLPSASLLSVLLLWTVALFHPAHATRTGPLRPRTSVNPTTCPYNNCPAVAPAPGSLPLYYQLIGEVLGGDPNVVMECVYGPNDGYALYCDYDPNSGVSLEASAPGCPSLAVCGPVTTCTSGYACPGLPTSFGPSTYPVVGTKCTYGTGSTANNCYYTSAGQLGDGSTVVDDGTYACPQSAPCAGMKRRDEPVAKAKKDMEAEEMRLAALPDIEFDFDDWSAPW